MGTDDGGRRPAGGVLRDQPAGARRRGRADAAVPAPGAAPARRAHAAHPARRRIGRLLGADPGGRGGPAARARPARGGRVRRMRAAQGSTTVVAPPEASIRSWSRRRGRPGSPPRAPATSWPGWRARCSPRGCCHRRPHYAAYLHGLAARLAAAGAGRGGRSAAGEGHQDGEAPIWARPMWWRRSRPRSARSRHSISGYGQPCGGERGRRRDYQEHRGGARARGPRCA